MIAVLYRTKAELKASIGKELRFVETSLFGNEYSPNAKNLPFVGPSPTVRKFYGVVSMANGLIEKVR